MSDLLKNKIAVVTGSSTGIGRAIVATYSAAGAAGAGIDIEDAEPELPVSWNTIRCDVADEQALAAAITTTAKANGGIDVVVANAGLVPPWSETESIDLNEWDQVFAVNVRGVMATIKHSVPHLRQRGGSIVVMGSLNSQRAHGQQCLYTATKHAVLGVVRSVALDVGRFGIRVNAIGPGPIATSALLSRLEHRAGQGQPAPSTVLQQFAADTALQRIATVDDVARTALFLASDLSAGMTGQILPVDAGLA